MSAFTLRHGEAVAIGVAVDTIYSSFVHGLPAEEAALVLQALDGLGLLIDHPALANTDELFAGLEEFRQHLGGRLTVTMLERIGKPLDVHEIDRVQMKRAIATVVERVKRNSPQSSRFSASGMEGHISAACRPSTEMSGSDGR
jgi:3-dehydroquinate synthase